MTENGELTALERAVLEAFVTRVPAEEGILREQVAACRVTSRELTGVGFFTSLAVPEGSRPLTSIAGRALSGVSAEIQGLQHGAGFVLWFEDGRLDQIEGFTYDEPWPERTDGFSVSVDVGPGPIGEPGPRAPGAVRRPTKVLVALVERVKGFTTHWLAKIDGEEPVKGRLIDLPARFGAPSTAWEERE